MKILEICEFSAGICGVWTRVLNESKNLVKEGHRVYVFSSNIEKGSGKKVKNYEVIEGVEVYRFKTKPSLLSRNVCNFNFSNELVELNPDVIITHLIHPHSFKALKECLHHRIPCILVTHAPFNVARPFPLNLATKFYYSFVVKKQINKFSKVCNIAQWEVPYLKALGVSDDKIVYLPNGLPQGFFKPKIKKFKGSRLMFFGRVAPVKNLEILIKSFNELNLKDVVLEIVGPVEEGYERIMQKKNLKVIFSKPVYGIKEKIKKLQESDIFVLPSLREGLPQSLLEAMALGKVVIASDTQGGSEVVREGKNGFLFPKCNVVDLKRKLVSVLSMKPAQIVKIQKAARKTALTYSEKTTMDKLTGILDEVKDG